MTSEGRRWLPHLVIVAINGVKDGLFVMLYLAQS
jgi:hypothetical protein